MKGKQNPKKQNQMDEDKKEFSLYNLLNIERNATQQEIKKSYRILALKFHPDKNQGDPQAKQMFQKIAEAYEILSNESKRKNYDQTGQIDDNQQFEQAYDYYRNMFPKITKDDIIDFEKRYRFGVMEEEDLFAFYDKQKGDIRTLLESIPLSRNEDVPRFVEYYESKIRDKGIKMWKAFDLTKKKIKLLKDESKEAELEEQKSLQDLNNQIQQRGRNYQNFLSNMEEKYAQKDPIKKKIKKTK